MFVAQASARSAASELASASTYAKTVSATSSSGSCVGLGHDGLQAFGRFDEARVAVRDAALDAQRVEIRRVEVERDLRHGERPFVVVQVAVTDQRDLSRELGARASALGLFELFFQELDRRSVLTGVNVRLDELLLRDRVIRYGVERALELADGRVRVALLRAAGRRP